MNDDKMAKDYNIEGGSVLHLVSAIAVQTCMLQLQNVVKSKHLVMYSLVSVLNFCHCHCVDKLLATGTSVAGGSVKADHPVLPKLRFSRQWCSA